MNFVSESTSPVHPAIVEAVVKANSGYATNFGQESWTTRAVDWLKEVFEHDLVAFPVVTGTAANAIALSALVPPYGAVLCHRDAHIETDECGAPEMFTAGARQIGLSGEHGRIDPNALRKYLEEARFGVVHAVQPSALSLTQQTEAGTAYSVEEARNALRHCQIFPPQGSPGRCKVCQCSRLYRSQSSRNVVESRRGYSCLGTTKTGTFGAEVIIAFDPQVGNALAFMRKRGGHFMPKSRFLPPSWKPISLVICGCRMPLMPIPWRKRWRKHWKGAPR